MEYIVFTAIVIVGGLWLARRNGAFGSGERSAELKRRVWQSSQVHGSARTSFSDARPGWSERHGNRERRS
jgi:hypothetical protein